MYFMLEYIVREYNKDIFMNIIEVKNNLVKLCYEEDLILSGLVKITDGQKNYIAQILHLEATRAGRVAVAKIIFNYDGEAKNYDGSIPSLRAEVTPLDTAFLLDIINHSNPLNLGKALGSASNLVVDFDILNDNPIILSEKFYTTKVLLSNLAMQLQSRKKKLVVFDTAGVFKANKLTLAKDFKLPLNSSTINYIYEKGFVDATAESKAMIQSIFEELSEYSKTVDFIPFDTFKAVVDSEFMRTKLMQLVIMKNKIKQIRDWNVFAQTPQEFGVLKQKFETENTIVLDISNIKESLQKECIKYVYSVLAELKDEFYAFTPLSEESSDKFILEQVLNTANVRTTLICDYDYANLSELKKVSKNMFMFTPLKQQKDFGGYNIFLQKLAEDEFIAYGKMTKFVPVIAKLYQMTSADVFYPQVTEKLETQAKGMEIPVAVTPAETPVAEPQPVVEEPQPVAEQSEEPVASAEPEPVSEEQPQVQTEPVAEEVIAEPVEEGDVQVETPVAEPIEEISTPVAETVSVPEVEVAQMAGATAEAVDVPPQSETVEEPPVVEDVQTEPQPEPVEQEPPQPQDEVQEALKEVPDIEEDDEDLSDDDLDMIEKLSKPDEEISVINEQPAPQPQPQAVAPEPQPVQTEPVAEPVAEPVQPEPQPATPPQPSEPLQTRANTTPKVPEYQAQIPDEDRVHSDPIKEGDRVFHEEFGEGVVEKLINYGDKVLCSISFATVGRRLLNPDISEMKRL